MRISFCSLPENIVREETFLYFLRRKNSGRHFFHFPPTLRSNRIWIESRLYCDIAIMAVSAASLGGAMVYVGLATVHLLYMCYFLSYEVLPHSIGEYELCADDYWQLRVCFRGCWAGERLVGRLTLWLRVNVAVLFGDHISVFQCAYIWLSMYIYISMYLWSCVRP